MGSNRESSNIALLLEFCFKGKLHVIWTTFLIQKEYFYYSIYFQGKLHVIWATGQQEDEFYKNDQLKYHGKQQRGIFVIGKLIYLNTNNL